MSQQFIVVSYPTNHQPFQQATLPTPLAGWAIALLLGILLGWQMTRRRMSPANKTDILNHDQPDQLDKVRFSQSLQWVSYGKQLERAERYPEAIAIYEQGLRDYPRDFRLWHERGLALAKLQRFEEAIASYDSAHQLRPYQRDLAHERGDALLQLGRYSEAVASFDVFLRYVPDSAHVLADRGYALYQLKRYQEALQSLNRVVKSPQRDRYSLVQARYYQIKSLRQLGQLAAALKSAQEAMQQHPEEIFKVQREELRAQIAATLAETKPKSSDRC